MHLFKRPIVLGSRSPRRLELLRLIVPPSRIVVRPPGNPEEADFDNCRTLSEITSHLLTIATHKVTQVREATLEPYGAILCADTTIVGQESEDGPLAVLGQPSSPDWQTDVREWFRRYYFGKTHYALTGVVIQTPRQLRQFHVVTEVRMGPADQTLLEWYLATGESLGKAGGYALQGGGSVFVESVQGSLTNVVGLPVRETRQVFSELGLL